MGINEKEERHMKCINFDLDTKQLLKIFPDSTREPYALIKKFFEDRGFEHRQYSGYISKEPLNHYDIVKILERLGNNFTWLNNSIQKFDVSNAPITIDMKETIIKSANKKLNNLNKPHINPQHLNNSQNTSTNSQNTSTTTQPTTKTNHTITPQTHKPKSRKR